MVTIDPKKCIGCQRCVSICPFTVLSMVNGKAALNADKFCLECMHCAAICPSGAISLGNEAGILPGGLPILPEDMPTLLKDFLMVRRSYRHFEPAPVDPDMVAHALQVASWAPSAKNQHPTKWIVVNDPEKITMIMGHILDYVKETGVSKEIASEYAQGNNVVTGTASTLILAYCRTSSINPAVDSALALYSAELILQSAGIGTCWAGYLTRMCNAVPALKDMLELPEGYSFYGALMAGIPKDETYIHIPKRRTPPDIRWL